MSSLEDKLVARLEELNVPEFVIEAATSLLIIDEDRLKLLDYLKEEHHYQRIVNQICKIAGESDAYGEEIDDNDELEEDDD